MDPFALTTGFLGGLGVVHGLRYAREHRTEPAGVADLVNWAFVVADGVVLQKDGAFLAGWTYRGPDPVSTTAEELSALSQHVNDALLPYGDHWMFHIDAIRRPATTYTASTFPNAVTAVIDAERRASYEAAGSHYETEYVWTVTHLPPPELYQRAAKVFVSGDKDRFTDWGERLDAFRRAITTLELRLSTRLALTRLGSHALLTHLHCCLTGLDHPVTPPSYAYLDAVLADQEMTGGFEPRIGKNHIRVVAVEGYPTASTPGLLDALNHLPYAYRWSNRVIPLGSRTAAKIIRRHQLGWFKKRKSAGTWFREMAAKDKAQTHTRNEDLFHDQHAQSMAEDAALALAASSSGAVRFCVYNQVFLAFEKTSAQADVVADAIMKTLQDYGVTARLETVNAMDAFLGTLPGHGSHNARRPLVSTANVSDLLPVTSVWPGLAANPSPYFPPHSPPLLWAKTEGSTPFRVHLHDSDVGHTLIIGPTGAGKSTLVGLIAAQFQRYPRAQVFICDVGYSAWMLAQAAGAHHYDIGSATDATLTFQPLAQIDNTSERMWAVEWLEMLASLQGVSVTPAHRLRLYHALSLIAENSSKHRTLTELVIQLQDADLVAALTPYTIAGQYGHLLDSSHDALRDGSFQVFELKHLLEMDDKILVPTLLFLFHRIEQRLDGVPTLIVIEELWAPLMRSVFANRVKQWLLTLRKNNAAVLLVAHTLAQLDSVPNAQVIIESCPTKIFLPNADAATSAATRYHALGLNDREVTAIARATPKRHYYFTSQRGARMCELGLGPATLAFLSTPNGMSAEETRQRAAQLRHEYGEAWPKVWLRERGLEQWASQYETFQHLLTTQ